MTLWYFCAGAVIFIVVGSFTDIFLRDQLYDLATQQTADVKGAVADVTEMLWIGRTIRLLLIALAAYFLAELSLKPLRQVDRSQKRFIANVSHELRTPLAIIKSASDIALRNRDDWNQEQAFQVISSNLEEVERMTKIIQFFLLAPSSLLQHNEEKNQTFPLRSPVDHVLAILQSLADELRVSLRVCETDRDHFINGDKTLVEQIILNLVKNALAHTAANGEIIVTIEQTPADQVRLSVADTGIGISPEDLPHIFEPFYRGQGDRPHPDHGNAGLGLSIVKELVNIHNATISVTSNTPHGTIFLIDFPSSSQ